MSLRGEVKSKPFIQIGTRPTNEQIGRVREPNETYGADNRSRFLIGGSKFGFGYRRRIFHEHIKKQLDPKTRYDTGDFFVDCLERAPRPTDKLVKKNKFPLKKIQNPNFPYKFFIFSKFFFI